MCGNSIFTPKTDGWSRKQCVERCVCMYMYVELIARDQCEPNRTHAVIGILLCHITYDHDDDNDDDDV
jgi:hypothetical protein